MFHSVNMLAVLPYPTVVPQRVRTPVTSRKLPATVANRTVCADFSTFKPLFAAVKHDLESGAREARRFGEDAGIKPGEFFILGGQTVYVAEVLETFVSEYGRPDSRLRVIYDNGTESDLLLRSLQRGLYKDARAAFRKRIER